MSTRTWIYLILAAIFLNSAIGVAMAYYPGIIKDPMTISSHNIINSGLALFGLAYFYYTRPKLDLNALGTF